MVGRGIRGWLSAVMFVGLMMADGAAYAQTDRGLSVRVRTANTADAPVQDTIRLYQASHALVIGIDSYTNGWPRLTNGVADAQAVAAALERRGFDVTVRLNPNGSELRREFEEFFIRKGADPDARLFVWFAGHGETIGGEGYLVPADAPLSSDSVNFKLSALPMRRFGEFVRGAQALHILSVFDSCFSGTIFNASRDAPPAAITMATARPVRQFLTSGDEGQKVSDDGLFRQLFVDALLGREEKADANGDGYVTGTELGLFLETRVINLTERAQTPRYGKLRDQDFDKGDFVWALPAPQRIETARPQADPRPAAPGVSEQEIELELWRSVRDSDDPADLEEYLRQFPNGRFATIAQNRLKNLRQPPTPPEVPPTIATAAPPTGGSTRPPGPSGDTGGTGVGDGSVGGLIGASPADPAGETSGPSTGGDLLASAIQGGQTPYDSLTDRVDRELAKDALQYAMEFVYSGEPHHWNNPASGNSGTVTPVKTFQQPSGQYCREYQFVSRGGGGWNRIVDGIACREPDGTWTLQQP